MLCGKVACRATANEPLISEFPKHSPAIMHGVELSEQEVKPQVFDTQLCAFPTNTFLPLAKNFHCESV